MKVHVQNLIIDMDMVLKPSKQVWPWEVPVMQEKYGEGKVRLLDTVEIEVEELPDAATEYHRLGIAFGFDGGEGGSQRPFVEDAYGRGKAGVDALAKAIKNSGKKKVTRRKKPAVKKPVKPEVKSDFGEDVGDPLAL